MSNAVEIYKYDMSNPVVRTVSSGFNFSTGLTGTSLGICPARIAKYGIWHTAIVVFDLEYSYGERGVIVAEPGIDCKPTKKDHLGSTDVSQEAFEKYVRNLRTSSFKSTDYHITANNCNHFSNNLCQYLLNRDIPVVLNVLA